MLLLDEPLAALDLKLRKRMQVELKQLQRELGISFLYVTHDQEEALALSDRIAVMDGGRVLQYGTGRELYDRPASEFVANFLGNSNVLECRGAVCVGGRLHAQSWTGSSFMSRDQSGRAASHRIGSASR